MKINLKYIFETFATTLLMLAIMPACSTYDDAGSDIFSDYGTAYEYNGNQASYYLVRDDGTELYVTSNLWPEEEPSDGKRVKFNYEITKTTDAPAWASWRETHEITLYFISEVRTEKPIMESFIMENEQHRRDSIGNDPIADITRMFFSGGYVNVEYRVYAKITEENDKFNMMNLVVDDVNSSENLVTVRVCYNAKGNNPQNTADLNYAAKESAVSFNLESLIPEYEDSITIKFIWTELQKGERSQIKTYYPYRDSYTQIIGPMEKSGVFISTDG